MGSPTFTRANTAIGVTTAGVSQSTIVPTYTAAAAGGYLVAIVLLSCSGGSGITCSAPNGNWTALGSPLHLANTTAGDDLYAYFFQNSAVDGSTSATFTFSTNGTPAAIVYELNSTIGVDTTNIFSATTVVNGSTVGTGSGTAQEANDYELIGGIQNDSNFSPSAITGFTNDMNLADHGDGGASFGGSFATFHANAVNSSTTISSQTITWTGAGSWALGFTLLLRPTTSAMYPGMQQTVGERDAVAA